MHVERSLDMADRLRDLLHANGWQVVNESPLAVLCFVDAETTADPAAIATHVVADGRAWISAAKFEGRPVLRACITSQLCAVGEIQSVDENGRGFPLAIDLHTVLLGNERDGMLTAVATPVRRDSDGRANKSHRSVGSSADRCDNHSPALRVSPLDHSDDNGVCVHATVYPASADQARLHILRLLNF